MNKERHRWYGVVLTELWKDGTYSHISIPYCLIIPVSQSLLALLPSLWSVLIRFSYSHSAIYFLPIPNSGSILHMCFLHNRSQNSQWRLEKTTIMPSLLHHVFWVMLLHLLLGLSSRSFSLPMGSAPKFTNSVKHPDSTSTSFHSHNCSTVPQKKIQASVPPLPILAILPWMITLLPSEPGKMVSSLVRDQCFHLQCLIYSSLSSAGNSFSVISIPLSQPNPHSLQKYWCISMFLS